MMIATLQRWSAHQVESTDAWLALALILGAALLFRLGRRLLLALALLRAMAWTPALARRLSRLVKSNDYSEENFFRADGADDRWVNRRRRGLDRLAAHFQSQNPRSISWGDAIREDLSDLRFTDAGRVPFPFMRVMRDTFNLCSCATESDGPRLRDLDDHWTLDLTGSYGVNVAGYNRYKEWMQKRWGRGKNLGAAL